MDPEAGEDAVRKLVAAFKSSSPLRIRTRARKIGTLNSLLNRLTTSFPSILGKIHCRFIADILGPYGVASIPLFPSGESCLGQGFQS